ncbi:MAG: hypothetical protein AAFN77_08775 [Planctomycetota bacterium]
MQTRLVKNHSSILNAEQLRPANHHARHVVGPPQQPEVETEQPGVTIQRVDGKIESIQIQCACGETITVRCNYE